MRFISPSRTTFSPETIIPVVRNGNQRNQKETNPQARKHSFGTRIGHIDRRSFGSVERSDIGVSDRRGFAFAAPFGQ